MPHHQHDDVLHDADHHVQVHQRAVAAVFALTFAGSRLEAEALASEAECLLCLTRALAGVAARLDRDAYAVGTRIVAHDQLAEMLTEEPPESWDAYVPTAPDDLWFLP